MVQVDGGNVHEADVDGEVTGGVGGHTGVGGGPEKGTLRKQVAESAGRRRRHAHEIKLERLSRLGRFVRFGSFFKGFSERHVQVAVLVVPVVAL